MKIIRKRKEIITLGVLFFISACYNNSTIRQTKITSKDVLSEIKKNVLTNLGYKSDTIENAKTTTILLTYNRSCNLNLDIHKSLIDASKIRSKIVDSVGMAIKSIQLEYCKFINENAALEVYKIMSQKADEVRNTKRRDLGNLCVWSYELQVYYVFKNKCSLLFVIKNGNYSAADLITLKKRLEIEILKY
ncbi:hypothetical protein BH11BAC3_BH11BAC3_27550 [soil metagenome]